MKPKVGIFSAQLLATSETFIRSQALALRDFEPVFVGLRRCPGLAIPEAQTIVLNGGSTLGALREEAFKATLAPPREFVSRLESVAPQLVHAHFATNGIFALPIAKALDVPLLVTFHGYDVSVADAHWMRSLTPWKRRYPARRRGLIESNARFVAVSDFIRRQAVNRGYPANRIEVIHIGVDAGTISSSPRAPEEPAVLFVGRLVEKKGCTYLLKAMAAVQRRLPSARTIVIGDGPLRATLEDEARTLGVTCEFLGARPHETVHAMLDRVKLVCVPSVVARSGDAEGLPMIVYEALAHARPVVAFRSAGIPEAVSDGANGALVNEGDVAGLADRLVTLLTDDTRWEPLSRAARADALRRFDLQSQTSKLERLYHVLAGGRHSDSRAIHAVAS